MKRIRLTVISGKFKCDGMFWFDVTFFNGDANENACAVFSLN